MSIGFPRRIPVIYHKCTVNGYGLGENMEPKPQESLNGIYVGDTVGVTTRNAGYIGVVEDIIFHDVAKGKSLIEVRLPNGATVAKWDKELARLDHLDKRDSAE